MQSHVTTGWPEALMRQGFAVVPGIALDDDNAALRHLGARLGQASSHGIRAGDRNAEQFGVNRVEAMDVPRLDPAGRVILSTSADDFPLHTDDTFTAAPVRWVLMHCWRADPAGGGVSVVTDLRDILPDLDAATIARLRVADFPSPYGLAPVLFPAAQAAAHVEDPWGIRFNLRDFVGYGERFGPALSAPQHEALQAVMAAAERHSRRLMLAPGDCLVVDNHRVLHGRSAFAPDSGRLLKRLRVH